MSRETASHTLAMQENHWTGRKTGELGLPFGLASACLAWAEDGLHLKHEVGPKKRWTWAEFVGQIGLGPNRSSKNIMKNKITILFDNKDDKDKIYIKITSRLRLNKITN